MQGNDIRSVSDQVVTGTLWLGSWRWSARLIGFVTTIILARLLVPEDFGILGTGAIVVGFFAIMTGLGTESYLIRHKDPDHDDYDTAWTLRLLVLTLAAIGIYFAAWPGADYFDDQRLVAVLQVLAIAGWLGGFANIGLTMYRRELQFRKIAMIGISQRLSASTATVALAVLFKNYWAMVIGEIVFMLVGLVLSYTLHSYRPRFTLIRFRQQWDFSKWIITQNCAAFIQGHGSSLIIVKFFGTEMLGLFAMTGRIAALPTQQLMAPVLPPLFSGLSKKQHDPEAFKTSILKAIGATAILMFPGATLLASLSEEIVTVVLGDRWLMAIPLVAPVTIAALLMVLVNPAMTVLTIAGRVKLLAGLNWIGITGLGIMLYIVQRWHDVVLLLWIQVALSVLGVLTFYAYMLVTVKLSALALFASIYRPLLASLVMTGGLYLVTATIGSDWLVILVGSVFGGISYLLAIFLFWRIAGSPDSGEVFLVRKLNNVIARVLKK